MQPILRAMDGVWDDADDDMYHTRAVFCSSSELEAGPSRTTGVPVAIAAAGLQYRYLPLRKPRHLSAMF